MKPITVPVEFSVVLMLMKMNSWHRDHEFWSNRLDRCWRTQ